MVYKVINYVDATTLDRHSTRVLRHALLTLPARGSRFIEMSTVYAFITMYIMS